MRRMWSAPRGADVQEARGEGDGVVFVEEVAHAALELAHDIGVAWARAAAADRAGALGMVLEALGDEGLCELDAFVVGGVPGDGKRWPDEVVFHLGLC